jgi:hypothetical protein
MLAMNWLVKLFGKEEPHMMASAGMVNEAENINAKNYECSNNDILRTGQCEDIQSDSRNFSSAENAFNSLNEVKGCEEKSFIAQYSNRCAANDNSSIENVLRRRKR